MIPYISKSTLIAGIAAVGISLSSVPVSAMNQQDMINAMAKETGVSKSVAARALKAFTNNVGKALSKGDRVSLVGFGSFSVSRRAARTGRNPQTGKPINIPAKNVVQFKAGKTLSDQVK